MKKLISICLLIAMIVSILPAMVWATEDTGFALYQIQVQNGVCSIRGRLPQAAETLVRLSAEGASTLQKDAQTGEDECFELEFPITYGAYNMTLSSTNGEKLEFSLDFSGLAGLFTNNAGYQIKDVSFIKDAVLLNGSHANAVNKDVALRIMNPTLSLEEGLKGIAATKGNEKGEFSFRFKIAPGEYQLYLWAGDAYTVSVPFAVGEAIALLDAEQSMVERLNTKLTHYVEILDGLLAECEDAGITTDYETAYREIINKFITYAANEVALGDTSNLTRYDTELTKLYDEAKENLKSYINKEKTPYAVPRFKLNDSLTFDGSVMYADMDINGTTENRPVFLTGWGHFNTPILEADLMDKLGMNITQTEVNMNEYLSPIKGDGWELVVNNNCDGYIGTTTEEAVSGDYSIKLSKSTAEQDRTYRLIKQEIAVKPNTTYVLGFKSKAKGIVSESSAWVDFAVNDWGKNRFAISNSNDWVNHEYEIRTGTSDPIYKILIFLGDIVDAAYIDDLYLKEKGTDINLAVNGNFDTEKPMNDIEKGLAEFGCYVKWDKLAELEERIRWAEQNNLMIDFPLGSAFIPDYVLATDPEMTAASAYFLPYALDNEKVRTVLDLFAQLMAPYVNDSKAINSICLTNEPKVYANANDHYKPLWHQYLKDKYGTVTAMNQALGTSYTAFQDVGWPDGWIGYYRGPLYYEYIRFNDSILADFHTYLAETIKKYSPDVKVYAKYIGYFMEDYWNQFIRGTDYEPMADLMDINGCDGVSTFGTDFTLLNRMGWYDLMRSMEDKPVWDTEHHTFPDGGITVTGDIVGDYLTADLWNGAIHGRNTSILWLWEDVRTTNAFNNTDADKRPEMVAAATKTNFDLNRLSHEVTALQQAEAKVGILYSRTSLVHNENHAVSAVDAYEATLMSGQRVRFVTDSNPETMSNYELLIVPDATHVQKKTLDSVKAYMEAGGKVLLLGENALKYDEHAKAADATVVNYIRSHADTASTVKGKIQAMNLTEVQLMDTRTGRAPENIEWSYTEYKDKYLLHVMNYDMEYTGLLTVSHNGEAVTGMKDLRSGKEYAEILEVKPYQPMLIAFEKYPLDMVDANGVTIEKNINEIKPGIIRCNAQTKGTLILALYHDDVLVKASIGSGRIEVPELTSGSWRLMAADWDMETLNPLAVSKNITMEVE